MLLSQSQSNIQCLAGAAFIEDIIEILLPVLCHGDTYLLKFAQQLAAATAGIIKLHAAFDVALLLLQKCNASLPVAFSGSSMLDMQLSDLEAFIPPANVSVRSASSSIQQHLRTSAANCKMHCRAARGAGRPPWAASQCRRSAGWRRPCCRPAWTQCASHPMRSPYRLFATR